MSLTLTGSLLKGAPAIRWMISILAEVKIVHLGSFKNLLT